MDYDKYICLICGLILQRNFH